MQMPTILSTFDKLPYVSVGVPCMILRGGSSKGAYFLRDDLPDDTTERNSLLQRIMGSPDPRQIDGFGGAHSLTSNVAVGAAADGPDADVDYLFVQVGVADDVVSDRQNCGNLLAGIGPFAVERGLLRGTTDGRRRVWDELHARRQRDASSHSAGGCARRVGEGWRTRAAAHRR